MPKSTKRTYSRYAETASHLLGGLIRAARKERSLTAQEVAERAGISRSLLQRIEKGALKCEIGAVFEVATIVGVPLFDADDASLRAHIHEVENKLALLPKRIKKTKKAVHDDF